MSNNKLVSFNKGMSIEEVKAKTKPLKSLHRKRNTEFFVSEFENRVSSIDENEVFKVSDVLDDYWGELSKGLKRGVGKEISNRVEDGEIDDVELYKKVNNGAYYIKQRKMIQPIFLLMK